MPTVERQALVPYSAQQMFDLIGDIERYPEFMKDCADARIIERGALADGTPTVTATLTIEKVGFSQSFTTRNALYAPHKMALELVQGPFKSLDGFWAFDDVSTGDTQAQGCKIRFRLDYVFRSALLGMMGGPIFNKSAEEQVRNLSARARAIYG